MALHQPAMSIPRCTAEPETRHIFSKPGLGEMATSFVLCHDQPTPKCETYTERRKGELLIDRKQ